MGGIGSLVPSVSIGTLLAVLSCLSLPVIGDGIINSSTSRPCFHHAREGDTIYSYNLTDIHEKEDINLSRYEDLVVLGIPCNQFELQEPGNNASEILNGVKYVRPGGGFIPNFPMFKKIDVNGINEDPLYTYLKRYCPPTRDGFGKTADLMWTPIKNSDIRWNWEKFLINKRGIPYMRYDPRTEPSAIRNDIEFLLQQDL